MISKIKLKKIITDMGIKIEGNHVRKHDVEKILAAYFKREDKVKNIQADQQSNLIDTFL